MTEKDNNGGASSAAVTTAKGVPHVVPLEITVRFAGAAAPPARGAFVVDRASAKAATVKVRDRILAHRDVVDIRGTRVFREGLLTEEFDVVMSVRPEASRDPGAYGLKTTLDGVPVAIEPADLESLARSLRALWLEARALMRNYKHDRWRRQALPFLLPHQGGSVLFMPFPGRTTDGSRPPPLLDFTCASDARYPAPKDRRGALVVLVVTRR